MSEKNQSQNTENLGELLKVRREKLAALQEAGKNPFEITKYDVTHHSSDVKENFEELEGKSVSLAGRIMSKRVMGKASFCHIQDLKGTIQVYVARDNIGEDSYKDFKKYDIGDIGRDFNSRNFCNTSFKEPPDSPRKIPRTYKYRYPLQTALC